MHRAVIEPSSGRHPQVMVVREDDGLMSTRINTGHVEADEDGAVVLGPWVVDSVAAPSADRMAA